MTINLVIVDHAAATIDVARFERDEVVIGRIKSCDVVLGAGNIAKRHATLRLEGPERLVITAYASYFGAVRVDGKWLSGSVAVTPYETHRILVPGWSLFLTDDVEGTVERQRTLLDAHVAATTLACEVAVQRQAAQRHVDSLPAADAVVVASGHGWRREELVLFHVIETLRGSPTPAQQLEVALDPPQRALVGLRLHVPGRVRDAFPSLAAAFHSPWLLHLRRPDGPGQPWLPVDPVLGVLSAQPELVALARRSP